MRQDSIEEIRKLYSVQYDKGLSDEENYRYFIKNDPDILESKKVILKIIEKRQLGSYMNNTKWLKLQKIVQELPFLPAYFEKLLTEPELIYDINVDEVDYYGDWSPYYNEGMSLFFLIEYIVVVPRHLEHIGLLIEGSITDISEEFEDLLLKNHIPFEKKDQKFYIYGYK